MAGIMDAVMGGVGVGVQPKDNPNPAAPPTDPTGPTFQSVMGSAPTPAPIGAAQPPAQTQPPQSAPAQSPDPNSFAAMMAQGQGPAQKPAPPSPDQQQATTDDQSVDGIFDSLKTNHPMARDIAKEDASRDLHSQLDDVLGGGSDSSDTDLSLGPIDKKPGESNWGAALRNLPDSMKFAAAQMRSKLGRNPQEQLNAFQSMFGENNAKLVGNTIQFRPEGSKKFRKVDKPLFDSMTDFVLFHALSSVPTAANVAAQGAVDAAGISSTYGAGTVPTVLAAGAVGGAVDAMTRQGMIHALDAFSARKQNDQNINLTNQVLADAGLNAVAGPIMKGAMSYIPPVKSSIVKLLSYLPQSVQNVATGAGMAAHDAADAVSGAASKIPGIGKGYGAVGKSIGDLFANDGDDVLRASKNTHIAGGGDQIQQQANVRVAFEQLHDTLFPSLETSSASGQVSKATHRQMGDVVNSAMDAIQKPLESKLSMLKDTVSSVASQQKMAVSSQQTRNVIKDVLQDYGYTFNDKLGVAVPPGADTEAKMRLFANAPLKSTIDEMAAFHNNLLADSLVSDPKGVQGTDFNLFSNYIKRIDSKRNFEGDFTSATDKESQNILFKVANASRSDRNSFVDSVMSTQQNPESQLWSTAYQKFSQNIDALTQFKTMLRTPGDREYFVRALTTGPNAKKVDLLDQLKNTLVENGSQTEWDGVRGLMMSNIVDDRTHEGVLHAGEVLNYLEKNANQPVVNRILAPSEKRIYVKALQESQKLSLGGIMTTQTKKVTEDAASKMIQFGGGDISHAVRSIFSLFQSDKKALQYLNDEGFMEAARKASAPELRQNIMKAQSYTDALLSKMTIVNVPTASKKVVQKYAPLGRALGASLSQTGTIHNIGSAAAGAASQIAGQAMGGQSQPQVPSGSSSGGSGGSDDLESALNAPSE